MIDRRPIAHRPGGERTATSRRPSARRASSVCRSRSAAAATTSPGTGPSTVGSSSISAALNAVDVDAGGAEVRVGPGATLGRCRPRRPSRTGSRSRSASCRGTGVAGLTLGGGVGWLTRAYGLSVDNLLGVDVVTADGDDGPRAARRRTPTCSGASAAAAATSASSTSFTFRAYPLGPDVFAGTFVYGRTHWAEALRGVRGVDARPSRTR